MKILKTKVPSYFLLLALTLGSFATFAFTKFNKEEETPTSENTTSAQSNTCNISINRLAGRKFIKPLLFVEKNCEADNFGPIKSSLINAIGNLKTQNLISNASVYVRLFNNGEWLSINDNIQYQPGSLFKVPLLITLLRIEEKQPGFLNKNLTFNAVTKEAKQFTQEFMKNKIQMGQTYSIKELMKYMIVHSDNNATMLLFNSISPLEFEKTFTDLGLDKNMTKSEGVISPKEYSKFWLTLYNGSYLNFDNSEYALQLLSKTDFEQGLKKAMPSNLTIAHKFGEKGNGKDYSLHETGIVYSNNIPYLVTIMTNGTNQENLVNSIQKIASTVHSNIESLTK